MLKCINNIFLRTKLHVLSNWMHRRSKTQMLFAHQETISNAGNGPWWHVYHMTIMSVFQTSYGIQAKVIKHPNCMFVQLNGNEMKDKNVNFTWRNKMPSRQWLIMICASHENNTWTELNTSALQLINVLWTHDALCQLRSVSTLECHWLTQCTLGYHWATQRILAAYTGTPLEKLSWNSPTLECIWRNLIETAPHWDATGETFATYTGTPLDELWQPTHTLNI